MALLFLWVSETSPLRWRSLGARKVRVGWVRAVVRCFWIQPLCSFSPVGTIPPSGTRRWKLRCAFHYRERRLIDVIAGAQESGRGIELAALFGQLAGPGPRVRQDSAILGESGDGTAIAMVWDKVNR